MRALLLPAASLADHRRCRELTARVHGLDPDAGPPEGWPERWMMAVAGDQVRAAVGLSGREACVRWFLGASAFPLARALRQVGARDLVELRLLSVDPAERGQGLATSLLAAAHSQAFLAGAGGLLPALLQVAAPGDFQALERAVGVRAQLVARLGDAHELRLVLPERDVPARLLDHPVPRELLG
jgi:GNAT superfamily N-acetyltransferase